MYRLATLVLTGLFALALPADAQKKPKDEVLYNQMMQQFKLMETKLTEINNRLQVLESELARVKQTQAEHSAEIRSNQNLLKATDTSLANMRLSSEQGLFSLKSDVTQMRQEMSSLQEMMRRAATVQQAPAPQQPAAPEIPAIEGYVTAVTDSDVTISLGAKAGLQIGSEFNVYRSSDPRNQVGIIKVVEIIDANNSKARILYIKPDYRLEFSDIVRPRT